MLSEEESLMSAAQDAAGDGVDISKKKTPELSTELPDPGVTGQGAESETVAWADQGRLSVWPKICDTTLVEGNLA